MPAGIEASGSSDSSGGGSGFGVLDGVGCCGAESAVAAESGFVVVGNGAKTGTAADEDVGVSSGAGFGAGAGVSSTVECLPVVQGGMARNSSNVRTRGLQHFQPGSFRQRFARHPMYIKVANRGGNVWEMV